MIMTDLENMTAQAPHPGVEGVPTTPSSSLSRCAQCNHKRKLKTKNLIVCIDGTSNKFGRNNTNVVKLLAKIDQESHQDQRTYYSSGIGTRPKSLNPVTRMRDALYDKIDMAIAWNVEEIVKDAYRWLAQEYQTGDQIYFFGFSRGAYQVRVLAEMIHEVGLIKTWTEKQIGTAYEYYLGIRSGNLEARPIASNFKRTFCQPELRVHFVGVWDTVSSVGLVKEDVFLSTSSSAAHACHFRHALAVDECRVKFMPEYLHEINSGTRGEYNFSLLCPNVEHAAKTCDIKEVWFPGCHSDVGGTSKSGMCHHAGNVSLLWMRREAAAQGLVLKSTDISWSPEDVDFGISNSMSMVWRMFEYLPVKHQTCFSGAGENALGFHRLRPRRIIPGQKVHASILYANAYDPKAMLGEGFDIPITELNNSIWETGLFDDTAAEELVTYLGSQQTSTPLNLYRLLFMLRFEEGKECIRKIQNWESVFQTLINNSNCESLVRLVAVVAWHEVSCDGRACNKVCVPLTTETLQDMFDRAKRRIKDMLPKPAFHDALTVAALLRPLAKHQTLQARMLTDDVFEVFFWLFDMVFLHPDWTIVQRRQAFGQVVDSMSCLLQCKVRWDKLSAKLQAPPSVSPLTQILTIIRTRNATFAGRVMSNLVEKLGPSLRGSNVSRLSLVLRCNDPHLLTAALHMVLTLARTSEGRGLCTGLKPSIKKLAMRKDPLVGVLAVEILLALYNPGDWGDRLKIRYPNVRANLAKALARVHLDKHDLAHVASSTGHPGRQLLHQVFGFDDTELGALQKSLIGQLINAAQKGKVQERTAATMTILKLCDSESIRPYLCNETDLLQVFIRQLRHKDRALLAAYALTICLKHADMKESIKTNEDFEENIVYMLERDYFDDAVDQVEGFQIFADLMTHAELREKIKKRDIAHFLNTKLAKGNRKEIRTSLICLDIFQSFDPPLDGIPNPWTTGLVDRSLEYLRSPIWKVQKAGLTILFALSQTERGVEAIKIRIPEVVQMLLPTASLSVPTHSSSPSEHEAKQPSEPGSPPPSDASSRHPSRMMGPACALCIFAQNVMLRKHMYEGSEYGRLKHLHLSGALVDQTDTSPWYVNTPNRADVLNTLDQMVATVDGRVPDNPMSLGDVVLPHIRHWERLVKEVSARAGNEIVSLAQLLGVSVVGILAAVAFGLVNLTLMPLRLARACIAAL